MHKPTLIRLTAFAPFDTTRRMLVFAALGALGFLATVVVGSVHDLGPPAFKDPMARVIAKPRGPRAATQVPEAYWSDYYRPWLDRAEEPDKGPAAPEPESMRSPSWGRPLCGGVWGPPRVPLPRPGLGSVSAERVF